MRGVTLFAAAAFVFALAPAAAEDAKPRDHKPVENIQKLIAAGRFEEAERDARALLADAEAASPTDSGPVAEALDALVTALSFEGKAALHETEAYARRAVSLKEKAYGPDSRAAAVSLTNLAVVLRESGAYGEARKLFERARDGLEKSVKPDDARLLACLNNFAGLLQASGDLEEARKLFEHVLEARETSPAGDEIALARALNNLAMALMDLGQAREALPLEKRALEIWERKLPEGHPSTASGANNLAWILHETGDLAAARPLYERALVLREKALAEDHPFLAFTRENLALALEETGEPGDLARALELQERALEARKRSLGPKHPLVARSLRHMARTFQRNGDSAHALDAALLAEEISREHLRWMAGEMAEGQALRYRESRDLASVRSSGLDVALSILPEVKDPTAAWRAWDSLVRSRALVLDEAVARKKASLSTDPETVILSKELKAAADRLAHILVRGPRDEPPAVYRQAVDESRESVEKAERALAAKNAAFKGRRDAERWGLAETAAALDEGSTLVAYARYSPDAAKAGGYVAFVLRAREKEAGVIAIGTAQDVDALVARWGEEAALGALRPGREKREAEAACRNAGDALRRRVWDPVAAKLGDARRVFVVPDGALHLVSFAALPAGEAKYLVEAAPVIQYLSSERDLLARPPNAQGSGLLAIGGPDFDAEPSARSGSGGAPLEVAAVVPLRGGFLDGSGFESVRFSPLQASAGEAREIATAWSDALGGKSDALVLTGAEATETAFKKLAPGRRILHVATHGFFLAGEARNDVDGLRGITRLKKRGEPHAEESAPRSPASHESPLLLSGLAFAGANRRSEARAEEEDGVLTAEEIAVLDLSTVELAVLSACDTGLGKVQPGEGVFGLRRAFQAAGARSLVFSLWSVEDKSAREWMRVFYRTRFQQGLDAAESVREASLTVLHSRRERGESTHPFYWAGFVAAGR